MTTPVSPSGGGSPRRRKEGPWKIVLLVFLLVGVLPVFVEIPIDSVVGIGFGYVITNLAQMSLGTSAFHAAAPTTPSGVRPNLRWNAVTAALVWLPKYPVSDGAGRSYTGAMRIR